MLTLTIKLALLHICYDKNQYEFFSFYKNVPKIKIMVTAPDYEMLVTTAVTKLVTRITIIMIKHIYY